MFRPPTDQRRDERCAEIRDPRSGGPDDGDVPVAGVFGEVGVVVLEDAEGEREPPEEGFEDVGGEEEAPGGGAVVRWWEG